MKRKQSLRDSYAAKQRAKGIFWLPRPPKAIKRGATGLSGARKGLRRVSDKARAKIPARKACCAAVRERSGGRCEAKVSPDCAGRHDHTHEILARGAGGSITDPTNCISTCAPCHRWIHDHSNAARELGLVAPRGS